MRPNFLFFLFSIGFLYSCCTPYTPEEYVEYIRNANNHLVTTVVKNNIAFTLQYESPEYLTLKELRNQSLNHEIFDSTLQHFLDYSYLDLSIEPSANDNPLLDKRDSLNYSSRLRVFSFGIEHLAYLLNGIDTVRCLMSQFINAGNLNPQCHFELMFPKRKVDSAVGDINFIFNDTIFKNGLIHLTINSSYLNKIPNFKI